MPTPAIPIQSPVWIWPLNLPISCYTAANGNVLLNPNLDVVTHLLFTRCLSSAYYGALSPRGKIEQKVRYGFHHSCGWYGAGGEWVSLLVCACWPVAEERTKCGCDSGILQHYSGRNFKKTQPCPSWRVYVSNKQGASTILGLLKQLLLGVATNQRVGHSTVLSFWTLVTQVKYDVNETHVGNAPWTANRSQW